MGKPDSHYTRLLKPDSYNAAKSGWSIISRRLASSHAHRPREPTTQTYQEEANHDHFSQSGVARRDACAVHLLRAQRSQCAKLPHPHRDPHQPLSARRRRRRGGARAGAGVERDLASAGDRREQARRRHHHLGRVCRARRAGRLHAALVHQPARHRPGAVSQPLLRYRHEPDLDFDGVGKPDVPGGAPGPGHQHPGRPDRKAQAEQRGDELLVLRPGRLAALGRRVPQSDDRLHRGAHSFCRHRTCAHRAPGRPGRLFVCRHVRGAADHRRPRARPGGDLDHAAAGHA